MDWQAGRVQCSGPLEVTGLNFDHVEAAVAALLDPFADRITLEAGLDLLRPVAPVGIDAAMVAAVVIEQDMSDLRQQDDFHFTINVHRRRHAGRHAPGAGIPIALAHRLPDPQDSLHELPDTRVSVGLAGPGPRA